LWVTITLRLFYVKIECTGHEHIKTDKPYIVLANHQNTLLDALLVLCFSNIKNLHFLARADIFNGKKIVKQLLEFFKIAPIYRRTDGISAFKKLDEVWANSKTILNRGDSICIFPEGTHSATYEYRPLKKGFLKLAQSAEDENLEFLPIIIHFENHYSAISKVWIEIKEPIPQSEKSASEVEAVFKETMVLADKNEDATAVFNHAAKIGLDFDAAVRMFRSGRQDEITSIVTSSWGDKLLLLLTSPLFLLASCLFLPFDFISKYLSLKMKDKQFSLSVQLVIKWIFYSFIFFAFIVYDLLTHPYWYETIIKILIVFGLGVFHKAYLYKVKRVLSK
tara:strand:+ start:204783 stop:205787 length:1005 start_codon:yes stop_codon:yes gene_type:complete